jgi:hypothetical protein
MTTVRYVAALALRGFLDNHASIGFGWLTAGLTLGIANFGWQSDDVRLAGWVLFAGMFLIFIVPPFIRRAAPVTEEDDDQA